MRTRAAGILLATRYSLLATALTLLVSACHRQSPVEADTPRQILHRGIGPEPAELDPQLATGANDHSVLSALFEGLVNEDPLTLAPVPGVAESWDISPDQLTYTFRLRKTARWSNNTPLTSRDFSASFQRILTPSLAADNANLLYIIQNAEAYHKGASTDFSTVGISTPDDHTLTITLEHPAPHFLTLLQHWAFWPVHLPTIEKNGNPAQRGNTWARPATIVSNGPFNLTEWKPAQHIKVVKSPSYWDAAAVTLNAIVFHPIEDVNAEERAYRSGQLHLTDSLPPSKLDTYRRTRPAELRIDPYLATYFYRINVSQYPLNNPKLRLALNHAIPRDAIAQKILRGGQLPSTTLTPPNTGTSSYTPTSPITTDFNRARQLLAEAGYSTGRDVPPIEILFNTSDSHRLIAEAIQETWRRELGLNVTLRNMENKTLFSTRRTGSYQILRSSWVADYNDPLSFLSIFESDSGNNYTRWSSPAYDSLLYAAQRTTAPAERNQLYQQAESLLLEQSPLLPIYTYQHIYLKHPAVQNWHPTPLDHHPYKYIKLQNP